MQLSDAPSSTSPSTQHVQNGHQSLVSEPTQDLKRKYLTLLPPLQIVDLCLTFEGHVPLDIRSTVWPADIVAAIAALQTQLQATEPVASAAKNAVDIPAMGSLNGPRVQAAPSSTAHDPPPSTTVSNGAPVTAVLPTVNNPPTTSAVPLRLPPAPSHYPHQPYGYTAQPSYPHAPYYPSPPPGFPYQPPPAQPPFLFQPPPAAYPPPHPPHPQMPQNPLFTHSPLAHPQVSDPYNHNNLAAEDLPSYEEMIVEALTDYGDPEGTAPKNLFLWMATHYPLQTNFRPSASQALQKAFKRGRLEKSDGGKYRLNPTWEGGNTSRRTTRRPQTQTQTAVVQHKHHSQTPPRSSPFTHAPLVHPTHPQPPRPMPGQPPFQNTAYQYSYSQPLPPPPPLNAPQPAALPSDEDITEGSDAWEAAEAAQNILRAINFAGLLQLSGDMESAGPSTPAAVTQPNVAFTSADTAPAQFAVAGDGSSADQFVLAPEIADARAALQAQLVQLAAQLAEIAQESENEAAGGVAQHEMPDQAPVAAQVAGPDVADDLTMGHGDIDDDGGDDNGDNDDDDDDDMEEVHVGSYNATRS